MITLRFNEHVIPECEPNPDAMPCWYTLYEGGEWLHISRFNPELGFHAVQYEDGNVYDARVKGDGYSPWRKHPLPHMFRPENDKELSAFIRENM